MSEEERRRCIILGICPPPPPAAAGESETLDPRAQCLADHLLIGSSDTLSAEGLAAVLGLIDEALGMTGE